MSQDNLFEFILGLIVSSWIFFWLWMFFKLFKEKETMKEKD